MSTFSVVVNKSGKKFAPKASNRRNAQATGSQASGSARTSVDRQPTPQNLSAPPSNAETPVGIATELVESTAPQISEAHSTSGTTGHIIEGGRPIDIPTSQSHGRNHPEVYSAPLVEAQASEGHEIVPHRRSSPYTRRDSSARSQDPSEDASTSAQVPNNPRPEKRKASVPAPVPSVIRENAAVTSSGKIGSDTNVQPPPRKRRKIVKPRNGTNVNEDVQSAVLGEAGGEPEARVPSSRSKRRAPQQNTAADSQDGADEASAKSTEAPTKSPKRRRQKKSMQEVAADIVSEAAANGGNRATKRKRKDKQQVENPEAHVLTPSAVKMSELCKDTRLGVSSQREAELEKIDWEEVKKKRKENEAEAERERQSSKGDKRKERPVQVDDLTTRPAQPQLVLVNGQLVIDAQSRIYDPHAEAAREANEPTIAIDETSLTTRVNQATVGRRNGMQAKGRWDEVTTDLFYRGLRMFGTDFMMISKMFPGMTRHQIKLKYTREERANLDRVHRALSAPEEVNLDEFAEMTNEVYEDPRKLELELQQEEKAIREKDAERRARETEGERGPDGDEGHSPEPGTANDVEGDAPSATAEGDTSAKENRFSAMAKNVVQSAVAPKKKRKQTVLSKKREARSKRAMEGTEEIIGSVEDIQA